MTGFPAEVAIAKQRTIRKINLGEQSMKLTFINCIKTQVKKQQLLKESQHLMAKKPQIC